MSYREKWFRWQHWNDVHPGVPLRIRAFSFPNEFPDYRYLRRVVGTASIRSFNQVFDEFLAHCESRVSRNDMASVTLRSHRKVLDGVWRPALGKHLFHQVRYSHLVRAFLYCAE
jgi:hypothetical protein